MASPARFREDANAEEDLLRGGYHDRWFVELAQNAADAASRAGTTTALVLRVVDGELRAANTGAPLDTDGVAALASLRASAKRGDGAGTGRFGVGFAAVTALTDAPRVVTRRADGTVAGVAFDRARTAEEVAAAGHGAGGGVAGAGLVDELARRDGSVPALRLVWPTDPDEPPPPDGTTTEVRLPLRPGTEADALLGVARAQAADLLLALPALTAVAAGDAPPVRRLPVGSAAVDATTDAAVAGDGSAVTDPAAAVPGDGPAVTGPAAVDPAAAVPADPDLVVIDDGGEVVRWRVVRAGGAIPAALLADLAVEDRVRATWTAVWAVRDGDPTGAGERGDVLHAPTPTDERTSLPARLLATVPLDPDRRHVRAGPVTDHVLAAAAASYPDLARALPAARRPDLVPRPALPASGVDATLRDAVTDALRTSAWLPAADGVADLRPSRAAVLDVGPGDAAPLAGVLADVLPDLVDPVLADPRHAPALAVVGVERLGAATLADRLAGLDRSPRWWRDLYDALAVALGGAAPARAREELAALPVPLADGRTVTGPRGTLLAAGAGAGEHVAALGAVGIPGLRLVHPDAAHPLLVELGAREADPATLLAEPAVLEAVERSVDDADAGLEVDALARAVLGLVAEAGPGDGLGDIAGALGALALPDPDGEYRRADELVLPDGALRALLDADSPLGVLDDDVAAAHPRSVLVAVGVLDGFGVVRDPGPAGPDHDLDDEETWWAAEVDRGGELDAAPGPAELVAVRDLELVADDRWDAAWPVLARDPAVREALLARPGAPRPYTAWWLARHARLAGRPPTWWRLPGATGLAGLYDPVPAGPTGGVGGGLDDGVGVGVVGVVGVVGGAGGAGGAGGVLDGAFLTAVGVRAGEDVTVTDADEAADLLARLADPDRDVDAAVAARVHAALARAVVAGVVDVADVDPPPRVRTAAGSAVDADPDRGLPPMVLDRPWLGHATEADLTVLPGPASGAAALADLLDLPLASARLHGVVRSTGTPTPWSAVPAAVAWASALGRPLPDGEVVLHERLHVLVVDSERPQDAGERTVLVWVESADGSDGESDDGEGDDRGGGDATATIHAADPVRAVLTRWASPP